MEKAEKMDFCQNTNKKIVILVFMECSHIPFGFPIGFGSQAAIKEKQAKKAEKKTAKKSK